MPKLQFRSVRSKLIASFLAVAALVAIVGVFAINRQSSIQSAYSTANANQGDQSRATTTLIDFGKMRQDLIGAILYPKAQDREAALATYSADASATLSALQTLMKDMNSPTAQEKAWEASIQSGLNSYIALGQDKAFPLIRSANYAAFADLRTKQISPLAQTIEQQLTSLRQNQVVGAAASVKAAQSTQATATTLIIVFVVVAVLLALALGLLISRSVSRPLVEGVESLEAMAKHDLTKTLEVRTSDETGRMASALNQAVDNLRSALDTISRSSSTVAAASEELIAVTTQISANAEETSAQSSTVASAGEEVSQAASSVAAAVDEMTAAVREISQNTSQASQVAALAVQQAGAVEEAMQKLGSTSVEIGNVVGLINSIAEQTNLLALNATIEAARAGDSGKGFAVVAGEVKSLAAETAQATEDISSKVAGVQAEIQTVVAAIQQITGVIDQINDIQTAIAAAVEQQAATTNEIGRIASEAAGGARDIAQNITAVATAARSTSEGVTNSQEAVSELGKMAHELQVLVGQFTY